MSELSFENIPMPKTSRTVESKYAFDKLVVGGPAIVMDVVDAKKGVSKLMSALVAYRARSGDRAKFSVRSFKAADGTDRVGAWKVADAPAEAAGDDASA